MTVSPREAKARFLETAALFYSSSSPVISACLMINRGAQGSATFATNRNHLANSCAGCGAILISGLTSESTIESSAPSIRVKKRTRHFMKKSLAQMDKPAAKWVKVKCLLCDRYEKIALEVSLRANRKILPRKSMTTGEEDALSMPVNVSKLPKSVKNQRSKQRVKARRQGGLRSLLEKSKKTSCSEPSFGLSLSDFMKQD